MRAEYTSNISFYVPEERLPIDVTWVRGDHPAKLFHDHDYTELAIVAAGTPEHITDCGSCELAAGDVLLIHPGMIHGYEKTDGFDVLNIIFARNRLPLPQLDCFELPLFRLLFPDRDNYHRSPSPVLHLEHDDLQNVIALIDRIDGELKSHHPGNMFCVITLFMQLLITISRISGYSEPEQRTRFMIGDALKYMNRHYQETVSLEKLARLSYMSERSFQRYFHRTMGCSPMEHLLKIRLRHVQEQLITSDAEISAIAINCGFYDSNYLCKKFKAVFGISPSKFRAERRRSAPRYHDTKNN